MLNRSIDWNVAVTPVTFRFIVVKLVRNPWKNMKRAEALFIFVVSRCHSAKKTDTEKENFYT